MLTNHSQGGEQDSPRKIADLGGWWQTATGTAATESPSDELPTVMTVFRHGNSSCANPVHYRLRYTRSAWWAKARMQTSLRVCASLTAPRRAHAFGPGWAKPVAGSTGDRDRCHVRVLVTRASPKDRAMKACYRFSVAYPVSQHMARVAWQFTADDLAFRSLHSRSRNDKKHPCR